MARYDWPRGPRSGDEPIARVAFLHRLRPGVDLDAVDPLVPQEGEGLALPHLAPTGAQNLWFPIGPAVMQHGQADHNPNVAGRIRDLQVEPTQGKRVYAASAAGGVWFSADAGTSWRPLDEWQTTTAPNTLGNVATALSCGALYVKFGGAADGSADVIWVGTGEPLLTPAGQIAAAEGSPWGELIAGSVAGIGFLNSDPAQSGGAWTVVKGDRADPDTLRGASFYRIVADPGNDSQLLAGTTRGLYAKPIGADWAKVTGFAASVDVQPMDVVITPAIGATSARIWVASASRVFVSEFTSGAAITPGSLTFTSITPAGVYETTAGSPPGTCLALATDGATVYVLGRSVLTGKRTVPPAAVWRIDASQPLNSLAATQLTGTPADLFMSSDDQSSYDMCITTRPTVAGRIYVGGASVGSQTGAIYRCETTASTLSPTLIGSGVHPDVHVLRVGGPAPADATKRSVWTGTDGGVFCSDSEGDPGTFTPRNNGLAVLQPGFVANHPTNPGIVAAGFQDNGTAVRVGDGVWYQQLGGDGGGVVFDPSSTNRFYRQYIRATWESSDNSGIAPVRRRGARQVNKMLTSESLEDGSCKFYSGCAAIAFGGDTHLVLGSDRVWYSRDWGHSWVTLPTGTDPRAGDNPDVTQDVLAKNTGAAKHFIDRVGSTDCCSTDYPGSGVGGAGIVTVRLSAAPNDADGNLVLRALALYGGGLVWLTGTRAPAATGSFTWTPGPTGIPNQLIKAPTVAADVTALTTGAPMSFLPAPNAVSDVYVHDPARGTLGSCYVATTGIGAASPLDTLWFFDGVSTWRPTGLSTSFTPSNGTWTVPADQVSAPALAVVVDPDDNSIVYVGTSVGVLRGVLTIGGTASAPTFAWTWTQFMNGLPEAVVQDLSIFKGSGLKLLRAALQARGVWEVDLANPTVTPLSYLRLFRTDTRRVLPTPTGGDLLNGDPNNPTQWDDSPDVAIDISGTLWTTPPSEGELAALPAPDSGGDHARVAVSNPHVRVHVLAHHRVGDQTVSPSNLRIALVRHALPDNGIVALGGLWNTLVSAATAATPPASLPDGWAAAGATLWQNPAGPVDPRLPRAVTFDIDLSDATGTAVVLLAVVMSTSNQISAADLSLGGANTAQTADQLVVASPHVAAKSVYVK